MTLLHGDSIWREQPHWEDPLLLDVTWNQPYKILGKTNSVALLEACHNIRAFTVIQHNSSSEPLLWTKPRTLNSHWKISKHITFLLNHKNLVFSCWLWGQVNLQWFHAQLTPLISLTLQCLQLQPVCRYVNDSLCIWAGFGPTRVQQGTALISGGFFVFFFAT